MNQILSVLVFLASSYAHAGFIAEPYLGIESMTTKGKPLTGTEAKSSASGVSYGARLGYRFGQSIWLAGDYKGSSGSDKSDSSSTDYSTSALSVLVGYQHNKYNFWAGYGLSETQNVQTTPALELTGTSFKAGFGYKTAENIRANVEVSIPKYTKVKSSTVELEMDQIYSSFDVSTVLFTVSYIFGGGR